MSAWNFWTGPEVARVGISLHRIAVAAERIVAVLERAPGIEAAETPVAPKSPAVEAREPTPPKPSGHFGSGELDLIRGLIRFANTDHARELVARLISARSNVELRVALDRVLAAASLYTSPWNHLGPELVRWRQQLDR